MGNSRTSTTGTRMMGDMNGDGLVDQLFIGTGGLNVRLNTGQGFTDQIVWAGGANVIPPLTQTEIDQLLSDYPLTDPVRRWLAPFDGTINLSGTVSKSVASDAGAGEDGVRIDVYKGTSTAALWSHTFTTVESVDLSTVTALQNLVVSRGEPVYLRVSSIQDSANDLLDIGINASYSTASYVDSSNVLQSLTQSQLAEARFNLLPNGYSQFAFNSADEFSLASLVPDNLSINRGGAWTAVYKGKVQLTNIIAKQVVSENLRFKLVWTHPGTTAGTVVDTVLFDQVVPAGDVYNLNEILLYNSIASLDVAAGDTLSYEISAPALGNIRHDRVSWEPEIRYLEYCIPSRAGVDIDDPTTYETGEGQTPEDYLTSETCKTLSAAEQELTDKDLPGAADFNDGSGPTKLYIFTPTPMLNVYPLVHEVPVMESWVAPRDGLVRIVSASYKLAETASDIHLKIQSNNNQLIQQYTFNATDILAKDALPVMDFTVNVTAGQRVYFNVASVTQITETVLEEDGTSVPAFNWSSEILYVDATHCYPDGATETCVPVTKDYRTVNRWGMNFANLCLAADRCVPVDCVGARHVGVPGAYVATACASTEPDPNNAAQTITVALTDAERASFALDREEYFVPVINRGYLDWSDYGNTPFAGHYRQWSYLTWNGYYTWNPSKFTLPSTLSNDYPYLRSPSPLIKGNRWNPGVPLWAGHGKDDFSSATQARPSRVSGNITPIIETGSNISVLRKTTSRQAKASFGAGPLGASLNSGAALTNLDLIDMNGDRYPDLVSNNRILFNRGTPGAGFNAAVTDVDFYLANENHVRRSHSKTAGLSFGLGYTSVGTNSKGTPVKTKVVGPSLGTSYGSSATEVEFVDINGDGLPDRVYRTGRSIKVRLNLGGDSFGKPETWAAGVWDTANISRLTGTVGTKFGEVSPNRVRVTDTVNASISYGYGSLAASGARTIVDLRDVNGDGLPDLVMKQPGENFLRVRINLGNTFSDTEKHWETPAWPTSIGRGATASLYGGNDVLGYQESWTGTGGYNTYIPVTIPIPFCCVIHLHFEPDANISTGEGTAALQLMDIDGDGGLDQVYREVAMVGGAPTATVYVKRSRVGKTNLLRRVYRPLGGRIELDYQRSGNKVDRSDAANVVDMNSSKWALSQVVLKDGQGNSYTTQFNYFASGYYSRSERENYGYARIQETRPDGATLDRFYHNQSYTLKGLPLRTVLRDKISQLFMRNEKVYDPQLVVAATATTPAVRFPALSREEQHFYEGTVTLTEPLSLTSSDYSAGLKNTYTTMDYDAYGNVTVFFDAGDTTGVASGGDDVYAEMTYTAADTACHTPHIVGKATSITVKNSATSTTELRKRTATIDCAKGGNLDVVNQYQEATIPATTNLYYFDNGNLERVLGPFDDNGQRHEMVYVYDEVVSIYPVTLKRTYKGTAYYSSTATYDYKYGQVRNTTDLNGNQMDRNYDGFGRLKDIYGPYEVGGASPTISFSYGPVQTISPPTTPTSPVTLVAPPYALTAHLDKDADGKPKGDSGTIDTVLITDGLKRVLQTKKDAAVRLATETSPNVNRMTVSGCVTFDSMGRVATQRYPTAEAKGTNTALNKVCDIIAASETRYDILDRVTQAKTPATATTFYTTAMAYGFGPDRNNVSQFETMVTDAKSKVKKTYKDVRGLITSVRETNLKGTVEEVLWTSYAYDPLKQIRTVTDALNNVTTVEYDLLGRRTVISNPDTGKTAYVYDAASNLTQKITANLSGGQGIAYTYEYNRLTGINYPNPDPLNNDITYTHGAPGDANNGAGRIIKTTEPSGQTDLAYGKLGEVVSEKRTVVTLNTPEIYTTTFNFDTFGRLLRLTYPDGEVLTHTYDSGGNLTHAEGLKNNYRYKYLKDIHYDQFEQRVYSKAGNEVGTTYAYDPYTRRLATLNAGKGTLFQELAYTYDPVANITQLVNNAPIAGPGKFGGPSTQTYTYDDLHRLVTGEGTYASAPNKTDQYRLDMAYSPIHNINSKNQAHNVLITQTDGSTTTIPQKKTSYDWGYAYNASGASSVRPHAPRQIGEKDSLGVITGRSFSYDANGNQTGWTHDTNGTNRTMTWDDDNHLLSVSDNGHEKTYVYDAAGTRVIKRGPQGESVYVNQYFTIRNGTVATKHVYAGTTRYASKMVKDITSSKNKPEKDLYYFHPDHLGSSSYVTDIKAQLYQHLEYFPFGETWIEEATAKQRTPYHYTAKELDEETGLYYYGARYYDPRTSVWVSVDPILDKYLPTGYKEKDQNLAGMGGIFNTGNLGMYSYTHHNPVRYTDPDGNEITIHVEGTNVTINITAEMSGPGASEKMAAKYKAGVEKNISGSFGKYNVITTVDVKQNVEGQDQDESRHQLLISDKSVKSSADVGGNEARLDIADSKKVLAHETSHLLGLDDEYDKVTDPKTGKTRTIPKPGRENSLMATTKRTATLDQGHIEKIIDAYKDNDLNWGIDN